MQNTIEVSGKKFRKDTIELIAGKHGAKNVNKKFFPILEAIDKPGELPFLLNEIKSLKPTEELRLALVRVQVHSELNMHVDLNLHQKRHYAAQTMEKLLWGELLLERGKKDEDEEK